MPKMYRDQTSWQGQCLLMQRPGATGVFLSAEFSDRTPKPDIRLHLGWMAGNDPKRTLWSKATRWRRS